MARAGAAGRGRSIRPGYPGRAVGAALGYRCAVATPLPTTVSTPALVRPGRWTEFCDSVLARTWHVVATVEELGPVGTITPVTLLPGALDEPLLLVHEGPEVRAFANVCSHRSAPILQAPQAGGGLRCPYHGRQFGTDGRCRHAPGFAHLTGADDLVPVSLARWGPLIFAAVAPAMPFSDLAGLDGLWPEATPFDPTGSTHYDIDSHALLWLENYLEGLHIPFVHPALNRAIDWKGYQTGQSGWSTVQAAPALSGGATVPWRGERWAGVYLALFPTTMVNVYPWGVSLNLVQPAGPSRTRVRYLRWVARPELLAEGAGAGLDAVEAEDDAIVEAVQRGARSRFARPARLAERWEEGVAVLHEGLQRLGFSAG